MLNLVATQFGIDIEAAYHSRPAPEVARLQLASNSQAAELASYRAREQQSEATQRAEQVAAWAADKPFFNEPGVAEEMARLIQGGFTNDVDKAYAIAIAANDSLRSASLEAAVQARLKDEEAKQSALVAKARRGAVSPPSAPGSAKPPGSANLNHREAMELGYDEIVARRTA